MNYIVKNQELVEAEAYLKNLSNYLKKDYEERGKYLFVGRLSYLMTAELFVSFLLLGIMIAKLVPIAIAVILILFTVAFFTSLALYGEGILKKAKLPIISKKSFLNDFLKRHGYDLLSDLDSLKLNLTVYDLIIDENNLEILLNKDYHKSMKKLKMLKRAQKIGDQND